MNKPTIPTPSRKQTGKRALFGFLALLVLGGAILAVKGLGPERTDDTAYYQVKRQDFLVTIVESGTLEAVHEVVVRNEVQGDARVIYLVPEGNFVKKGDLVVQLETYEAEERLNQQELAYEKANSLRVQADQDLEIQKSVIQSAEDAVRLKLKIAELDFNKFKEGQRLQELRNAEIEITTAKSDLLLAKDNLEWSERLFSQGFETKNAVDQGRNSVQDLNLKLEKAQTNLWVLTSFDHPKMAWQFESSVEEAQNELDRTIAQGVSKISQLTADLITQSNSLALTFRKLEGDREQLAKSKIYAPRDGLVVYAMQNSRFSSQSLIEEGAQVRERQELIKLPDTSQMKVDIKVHESHVGKIRAGLAAFVVLDPLPDKRFRAQVTKVGLLPDTQTRFGNPNLKVYNTEVLIQDTLPDVKPGVSARAEIVITNIPNALTVPIQAVTSRNGLPVVFVRNGRESTPTPVEVGLFNNKFIEIVSGLEAGQLVLLTPPFDAQATDLGGTIIGQEDDIHTPEAVPVPPDTLPPNFQGEEGRRGVGGERGEGRGEGPPLLEPNEGARRREGRDGERQPRGERPAFNREEMMKRFDTNGDGELDETERAAMRTQFQRSRPEGDSGGQPGQPQGESPGRQRGQPRGDSTGGQPGRPNTQ